MANRRMIGAMWGTSNLRLFLLEGEDGGDDFMVLDQADGPGASRLTQSEFELVLDRLTFRWREESEPSQIALSGSVGSSIGWHETPYLECPRPVGITAIGQPLQGLGQTLILARGLSCTNPLGEPDIMRGEETELIGLAHLRPDLLHGTHLVCIPGTHAKYVLFEEGVIETFQSSVAGELFEALVANGVLVEPDSSVPSAPTAAFMEGVRAGSNVAASVLHNAFSVRSRRVLGQDENAEAIARLSGLIIADDVRSGLGVIREDALKAPVIIIGAPKLASLYAAAFDSFGYRTELIDPIQAATAGLWRVTMAESTQ